jgi:VanZ family protein
MLHRLAKLPRWLRDFLPLVLWLAFIFYLSAQPTLIDLQNDTEEKFLYKTAHFMAYALLFWLWWRALTPRRHLTWGVLLTAFGLTVLYGVSDEIHQLSVPGRHGRLADVLFDASGALAMLLLLRRIKWLRTFPGILLLLPFASKPGRYSKFSEVNE